MPKGKHLTLNDRQSIQMGLNEGLNFREIAESICKDQSTVSKEVRNHIVSKRTEQFNPCDKFKECDHYGDICHKCRKEWSRYCRNCNIGRTYEDFLDFLSVCPDTAVVEMDSVEGRKGGKVLLTIYFRNCELMLAFIRDANTARSVTDVFNLLDGLLGRDVFRTLFPVILTDRGSEFTDPSAVECDENGEKIFQI